MSQEIDALDLVRRWIDAFNREDWEAWGRLLAPEATFTFAHDLPDAGATRRGREALVAGDQGWRSSFSKFNGEIVDGFSSRDRVAVQMWWSGIAASNDNPIGFAACFLITVEDDQITRIVDFYDQLSYDAQFK